MTMMKMKNRFRMVLLCVLSALFLVSCQKAGEPLTLVLSSDKTFTDQAATLTLTLSNAAPSEITVRLSARETPLSGKPSVPAAKLSFPQSVSIAPGSSSATVDVTLAEDATGAQAIIEIAGVTGGATLAGDGAAVIATGQSYSGGEQGGEGGEQGGGQGGDEVTTVPFTGTPTLKPGWTLSIEEVGSDELGDYILVNVTTDAQLFAVDYYTEAEMAEYYPKGVSDLLTDYQSYAVKASTSGEYKSPSAYFWTPEDDVYCNYYEGYENGTDFYIMEFGTDWLATGNYGKVHLNVPVLSGARQPLRVKIAPRHKRAPEVKLISKRRKK